MMAPFAIGRATRTGGYGGASPREISLGCAPGTMAPFAGGRATERAAGPHRGVRGGVPPGDIAGLRARYDGAFCRRARNRAGRRPAPGGTGGRPPGRYRWVARPVRWRLLPAGAQPSGPQARTGGYGGASPREISLGCAPGTMAPFAGGRATERAAGPHRGVRGGFPPGDIAGVRARYDGAFCRRARNRAGRRPAPGGTGGRPPGRYRWVARPVRWRLLPAGAQPSGPQARTGGYGGASPREISLGCAPGTMAPFAGGRATERAAGPHRGVRGGFPPGDIAGVRARYDGAFCRRARNRAGRRPAPGGTGGLPPGRYRWGARPVRWRLLPAGAQPSGPQARTGGYGGASPREISLGCAPGTMAPFAGGRATERAAGPHRGVRGGVPPGDIAGLRARYD